MKIAEEELEIWSCNHRDFRTVGVPWCARPGRLSKSFGFGSEHACLGTPAHPGNVGNLFSGLTRPQDSKAYL